VCALQVLICIKLNMSYPSYSVQLMEVSPTIPPFGVLRNVRNTTLVDLVDFYPSSHLAIFEVFVPFLIIEIVVEVYAVALLDQLNYRCGR
jgi:hypothetical protein